MKRQSQESIVFGKRLKELRTRKSLTAAEVANRLNVAVSTYREWEQGRAITGLHYVSLANIFEVGLHQLFGLEDRQAQVFGKMDEIERIIKEIRLFF